MPTWRSGRGAVVLAIALVLVACAADDEHRSMPINARTASAIQRAAVLTLFLQREHAHELVFWDGARAEAPTLSLVPPRGDGTDALPLRAPDVALLRLPVPATVVQLAALEAHFAAHPDGWRAWFVRYPASGGLIELTAPLVMPDVPGEAVMLVGRTCGEHCHHVWRVRVRRDAAGGWRTDDVLALAVPKS